MSTLLELGLFAVLAGLLVLVSVVAGALWQRVRSVPTTRATLLARDLVERLQVLETLIERLEHGPPPRGAGPATTSGPTREGRPGASVRLDLRSEHSPTVAPGPPAPAPVLAASGPTLIAVPGLSSPSSPPPIAENELAGRFGAIWGLADQGEPVEAISRATGVPIGQVELILGLRRRTTTGPRPD